MRKILSSVGLSLLAFAGISQTIHLNQVGYYPEQQKQAIVSTRASTFEVRSAVSNNLIYSGDLSSSVFWAASNEAVKVIDFSPITQSGEYYIKVGASNSYTFTIGSSVNEDLLKGLSKAYYFNRASTALSSTYAGVFNRPLGHPDNQVTIHSSAAGPGRPTGSKISSPKGWYDAGDYGKYIVNSGISTYTVLAMYEHFPSYFADLDFDIPESGDNVPDVLDEAKWNLDWMLTMQDPNDGGVYHKLTTKNFQGIIMPHEGTAERFVVMKSTAATLDFAAVMAQASRVYASYEAQFPGFSAQCLKAAEDAWNWARFNTSVTYNQPSDILTGEYGDSNLSDEFDWAAAELYITTRNNTYYTATNLINTDITTPGWQDVKGLAWMSLGHHIDDLTSVANKSIIRSRIIGHADDLLDQINSSAYKVSITSFPWGSNSFVANQGLMLVQAFKLTGDRSYLSGALSNFDYILGKNPTGYSFVTGFGSKSPMSIHHRQSEADDIVAPVPGFVAGGPNSGRQDNCNYASTLPALSYVDDWCSYASNEVTINWNAPVAYLAAAFEVYNKPQVVSNVNSKHKTNTVNVYPTISENSFTVSAPSEVTFNVVDAMGQIHSSGSAINGTQIGTELAKGTYFIQFNVASGTEAVKVIKN